MSKPRRRRSASAARRARRGGRHGNDERLRRERPAGNDVDVLPGVAEQDLGIEQRVDDPVALDDPGRRGEPVQDPAEDDETDTVPMGQVPLGERRGRSHGEVEGAGILAPCLDERVEEDDDVGVPLRMHVVDPELARPRGCAPVDPPQPVPVDERAKVGELDAVPALTRDLVPCRRLRLERSEHGAEPLGRGVHLERPAVAHALLVDEEAERIAAPDRDLAERVRAPVAAFDLPLELDGLPAADADQRGVQALDDSRALGQHDRDLGMRHRCLGPQLQLETDRAALDRPLRAHCGPRPQ